MIKSIFVARHEAAEFTHVSRHSFLGITLPPSEATRLFSLQRWLDQNCEEENFLKRLCRELLINEEF